jgi:3'-phosphoadenosine 5'-phosphosulfate sulfotransferase (PAPS reductase)/FAD synthetase
VTKTIALPGEGAGLNVIASVSGGKDSTALILALRDAGIEARYVFADTGWEADETYEYLDYLRTSLGIVVDVVRAYVKPSVSEVDGLAYGNDERGPFAILEDGTEIRGAMMVRALYRAGFPGRMQRWCTRELKIEPLRAYHDRVIEETGIETVSAMGVRALESKERASMPEWEDEESGPRKWGGYLWRPLITWTIQDVLEMHNRHGLKVNKLYQQGFDRVGCYPCIYERKGGIRLIPASRISQIRGYEQLVTRIRRQRNEAQPGRYAHEQASFFLSRGGRRVDVCKLAGTDGHRCEPVDDEVEWGPDCVVKATLVDAPVMTIDEIHEWARTDRGGKQFPLFEQEPSGGCMRWGICDLPPESE